MPAPEQRLCLVLQPVRSKKENYCILNNDDREGGINSIPLVSLSGPGFVIQYLSIGKHWAARCFFVIQWNLYHGSFEKNLLKYQPYPTEYLQHCRPGKKRYVYVALEFGTYYRALLSMNFSSNLLTQHEISVSFGVMKKPWHEVCHHSSQSSVCFHSWDVVSCPFLLSQESLGCWRKNYYTVQY